MGSIGEVFTPLAWGRFAVSQAGLVDQWLSGRTILDPTLGNGQLLAALVESALADGHSPEALPFGNLYGIELDPGHHDKAVRHFQDAYGVDMGANFRRGDFFELEPHRCHVVLGNPPWINFSDLPTREKQLYKERFLRYGLAPDTQKLLLGGARIDVAALVVQKALLEHLTEGGEAWFFLPLSLFLNDGAHQSFRAYSTGGVSFAPQKIFDFQKERVFPGISTRYGLVCFHRDQQAEFPIPFFQWEGGTWRPREARPVFRSDDPLSVGEAGETSHWSEQKKIPLERRSLPRQGVNTGGANSVFFFEDFEVVDEGLCRAGGVPLPRSYVHPLITGSQFRDPWAPAHKWVLLPCDDSGKPLSPAALGRVPLLRNYLETHRQALLARKGALLQAWRNRGIWWALLGVGPYNFAPYKVVWEAFGKERFRPILLEGAWQANQSLQAFIPCWTEVEALRILDQLRDPFVESYLRSLKMAGTMNWAQPGKIRRLLCIGPD